MVGTSNQSVPEIAMEETPWKSACFCCCWGAPMPPWPPSDPVRDSRSPCPEVMSPGCFYGLTHKGHDLFWNHVPGLVNIQNAIENGHL